MFLGRFQPFHRGHHHVVETYRPRYEDLVVVIGSAETARTPRNPLSAVERRSIIRACHPNLPLVDLPDVARGEAGYPDWAEQLATETEADVVITRNDLVTRLVREYTDARVEPQPLLRPEEYSGTEIRRRIRDGDPWRALVPGCCVDTVAEYVDVIRGTAVGSTG